MKKIKFDTEIILKELSSTSGIHIIVTKGTNYNDWLLLTKHKGSYFWHMINAVCVNVSMYGKANFNSLEEAILAAAMEKKEIYEFENIAEFIKWMYEEDSIHNCQSNYIHK